MWNYGTGKYIQQFCPLWHKIVAKKHLVTYLSNIVFSLCVVCCRTATINRGTLLSTYNPTSNIPSTATSGISRRHQLCHFTMICQFRLVSSIIWWDVLNIVTVLDWISHLLVQTFLAAYCLALWPSTLYEYVVYISFTVFSCDEISGSIQLAISVLCKYFQDLTT